MSGDLGQLRLSDRHAQVTIWMGGPSRSGTRCGRSTRSQTRVSGARSISEFQRLVRQSPPSRVPATVVSGIGRVAWVWLPDPARTLAFVDHALGSTIPAVVFARSTGLLSAWVTARLRAGRSGGGRLGGHGHSRTVAATATAPGYRSRYSMRLRVASGLPPGRPHSRRVSAG